MYKRGSNLIYAIAYLYLNEATVKELEMGNLTLILYHLEPCVQLLEIYGFGSKRPEDRFDCFIMNKIVNI